MGRNCGVAYFVTELARVVGELGYQSRTEQDPLGRDADLMMVHYHPDLWSRDQVVGLVDRAGCAVVVIPHEQGDHLPAAVRFDGYLQFGVDWRPATGATMVPSLLLGHPAWVPAQLDDRAPLRAQLGLSSPDASIVGSSGFLRNDRQFLEVCARLLTDERLSDVVVHLVTTDWLGRSGRLITALEWLAYDHPGRLVFQTRRKARAELNSWLQACDLLWSWNQVDEATRTSNFLSGAIADQYASGTRPVCSDVPEHRAVASLPNVVVSRAVRTGGFARHRLGFSGDPGDPGGRDGRSRPGASTRIRRRGQCRRPSGSAPSPRAKW